MEKKINTHKDYRLNGIEYPSVTNILKILNKSSLVDWANFMGFKRMRVKDILHESSAVGTYVHYLAQCKVMDMEYAKYDTRNRKRLMEVGMRYRSFLEFYDKNEMKADFMERSFISDTMKYAGTMDFYGDLNGKKTLLDFKTSKGFYDSMFIQLAGYNLLLKENNLPVENYAILLILPTGCKIRELTYEELIPYEKVFLKLLELYEVLGEIKYV